VLQDVHMCQLVLEVVALPVLQCSAFKNCNICYWFSDS